MVGAALQSIAQALAAARPDVLDPRLPPDRDRILEASVVVLARLLTLALLDGDVPQDWRSVSTGARRLGESVHRPVGTVQHEGLLSRAGLNGRNALLDGLTLDDAALETGWAAVVALLATASPPSAALSLMYEAALCYRLIYHAPTGELLMETHPACRRTSGSFYTPRPVARLVVRWALDAAGGSGSATLLDPAMGTGAFLLEAVQRLAPSPATRGKVAERQIYGVDLNPLAVELAILTLWLETGACPALLARRLRHADALARQDHLPPANVVVGNPPWGAALPTGAAPRAGADTFKLFLDLGARACRQGLAMIVPQAVLLQERHADIRRALLARLDPYRAATLEDSIFPGAVAPACILVFGPKPGPKRVRVDRIGRDACELTPVPAPRWSASGFPLDGTELLDLLQRLQTRHGRLGDRTDLYRVRDTGINYNRASVARKVLYVGAEPEDLRDIPRYRGRDFDRYRPVRVGGWLRHDASQRLSGDERLTVGWETCRLPQKIVLRQTSDRLIATLDTGRMAMGRSVIAITREGDASLLALLACLNSSLLTALYRVLAGEKGRILPQVKVGRLLALPVPDPRGLDAAAPIWRELHECAARLLDAQGTDRLLDTRVDRLVHRLYGLSEAELSVLER